MKTLLLLLIPVFATSQQCFEVAMPYTIKLQPALALNYQYQHGSIQSEIGLKTNFNEYYTTAFIGAGVATKGKFYASLTTGVSITLNIPQLDRQFFPETGEIKVISYGYTKQSKVAAYLQPQIGYGIFYAGWHFGWRQWGEIGIRLR